MLLRRPLDRRPAGDSSPTVGDITTGVTRPGGAGLRHDDHPMKPNIKLEDGGSVMGLRPRGGLRPVVINRR